ncbi:BglG family transcription antiterminator [Lactovum odontotermitis]
MYKTRLTPRQIDLLIYLLKAEEYTTSTALAQEFGVSIRTIKNEISYIRDWLKQQGEELSAVGGKGYIVAVSPQRKLELNLLLESKERLLSPKDHQMRAQQIIIDLFVAKEELTIAHFSEKLQVSQNTIFNDFLLLEKELEKANVHIQSNHYGYTLEGNELAVRNVAFGLLQNEFTNFDVGVLLNQLLGEEVSSTGSLISQNAELRRIYQTIIRIVTENLQLLNEEVENYTVLSLIIRLCCSVSRMKNSHTLGTSSPKTTDVGNTTLRQVLSQIYDQFDLPQVEEEFQYILAKQKVLNSVDIPKFTEKVILEVSKRTKIRFEDDLQLFQNLYTHFSLRFSKGYIYLNEYNPFVSDIRRHQQRIFNEVQAVLYSQLSKVKVEDSFAAYVTLHFLASIERQKNKNRKISILYVCSTGVGVASFIQQKISNEVKGISILGFASVLNCRRYIEQLKPDLVVSVFPIEKVDVPVIEVKALLSKTDIARIQEQVNLLLNAGYGSLYELPSNRKNKVVLDKTQRRDVIIRGYTIYEELKLLFENNIKEDFKEGFLLHVLLMTRRMILGEQYTGLGEIESSEKDEARLAERIKALCQKYGLDINKSEISALLQYVERAKHEID